MQAFVLRIAHREDLFQEALNTDQIIIGYAEAEDLLEEEDWERFRKIIKTAYYPDDSNYRRAGQAGGDMWRFIRDMRKGDLVVVPHNSNFYVAEIAEEKALFKQEKQDQDSAYRRSVKWLNKENPIPRKHANSALQSRMRIYNTSAGASDLLSDIQEHINPARLEVIQDQDSSRLQIFGADFRESLIEQALEKLRKGKIENFGFENLIKSLLLNLGAKGADIIPRKKDKGADIIASFWIADMLPVKVAVQAKHWQPDPPVGRNVVKELIGGIKAEDADLGVIVTTGTILEDAEKEAEEYFKQTNKQIRFVDGELLATMIIEQGAKVIVEKDASEN